MTNIEQFHIETEENTIDRSKPEILTQEDFLQKLDNPGATPYTRVSSYEDGTFKILQDPNNTGKPDHEKIYAAVKIENGQEHQIGRIKGKQKTESLIQYYGEYVLDSYQHDIHVSIEKNNVIVTAKEKLNAFQKEILHNPDVLKQYISPYIGKARNTIRDLRATKRNINRDQARKTRLNRNDKATPIEKNFYKLFMYKIETDTNNLDQLIVDLRDINKQLNRGTNLEAHGQNAMEICREIQHLHDQSIALADAAVNPDTFKNYMNKTDWKIDFNVKDREGAQLFADVYNSLATEKQKINFLLHDAELKKIESDKQENLYEYLMKAIEDKVDPNIEPFVPSAKHKQGFQNICKMYPVLHTYTCGNNSTNPDTLDRGTTNLDATPHNPETQKRKSLFEKLTPSFVNDWIENSDMSAQSKRTFKTASGAIFGVLLAVGAFKAIKGAANTVRGLATGKKLSEMKGDMIWTAAGLTAFLGAKSAGSERWNVNDRTKKIENGVTSIDYTPDLEDDKKFAVGIQRMHEAFHGFTYEEMRGLIEKDSNGHMVIKYEEMKNALSADGQYDKMAIIDKIKNEEKYNMTDYALNAIGITREKLQDPDYADEKFDDTAGEAIVRVGGLYEYMETHNYEDIDDTKKQLVYDYFKLGDPTLDELADKGVFIES